jgi:hypothetical protein
VSLPCPLPGSGISSSLVFPPQPKLHPSSAKPSPWLQALLSHPTFLPFFLSALHFFPSRPSSNNPSNLSYLPVILSQDHCFQTSWNKADFSRDSQSHNQSYLCSLPNSVPEALIPLASPGDLSPQTTHSSHCHCGPYGLPSLGLAQAPLPEKLGRSAKKLLCPVFPGEQSLRGYSRQASVWLSGTREADPSLCSLLPSR